MSLFALAAIFNMGTGPVMAGWMEMNPKLQWKWIQWVQMTYVPRFYEGRSSILILYHVFRWSGAFILIVLFFFAETRSTIVLQKIAKQMRKKTGDKRYKARVEKPKMRTLIWISCTRPLSML